MNPLLPRKAKERFALMLHCLSAAILVAVAAGVYWGGIRTLTAQIATHQQEFEQLREHVENHDAQLARMRELEAELEVARTRLEEVERSVPHEPNIDQFLADLGQISEASRVAIKDYRPGAIQVIDEKWRASRIRVNIVGSFGQICHFLATLEQSPRKNTVRTFQITPNSPAKGQCTASVELEIYSHAETAVAMRGDDSALVAGAK